jgi:hypothetical protein
MNRIRTLILFALFGTALLVLLIYPSYTSSAKDNGYRVIWDDFKNGFQANGPTNDHPDAKWFYFSAGPIFIGNDGIESTTKNDLFVLSDPYFISTLGQEGSADNPFGLPGGLDHVKWLVYMNHLSSSGVPGFDAIPGQELACESWISGRTFGTEFHPFGDAVDNPNDDLRLGAPAMNAIDLESWMVFDFFLTNERIYAFYERLPFGRTESDNYAAFSFMIPVGERTPNEKHHLKIAYDKSAGTVRWLVDDQEVYRVDQIGYLIDRQYMTIDHGGIEPAKPVSPNQLNCGMGTFTLLDGSLPSGKALVRLSTAPGFYFDPSSGEPVPQTFVDEYSESGSRLFNQGVELRVSKYIIESRPVGRK